MAPQLYERLPWPLPGPGFGLARLRPLTVVTPAERRNNTVYAGRHGSVEWRRCMTSGSLAVLAAVLAAALNWTSIAGAQTPSNTPKEEFIANAINLSNGG